MNFDLSGEAREFGPDGVKTFIFSKLSEHEKERFMDFIILNNVQFEQDEDNCYVATVRIINQNQNASSSPPPNQNQQNGAHPKSVPQISKTAQQMRDEARSRPKSPLIPAHGQTQKSPALPHAPKPQSAVGQNRKTTTSKSPRLATEMRGRQAVNRNKMGSSTGNTVAQPHVQKPPTQALPSQKSKSPVQKKKTPIKSEAGPLSYDDINKPFVPKTRPLADIEGVYHKVLKIAQISQGIRPKKQGLANLIKIIEELYTARFQRDTSFFKNHLGKGQSGNPDIPDVDFPQFIHDFMIQKFKHKKLVDQNMADLIASIDHHKKESLLVETFAKFILADEFDSKDLIFFLYVRFLIEKEIGFKFFVPSLPSAPNKKQPTNSGEVDQRTVFLNMRICKKIAKIFFEEEKQTLDNFMVTVEQNADNVAEDGEHSINVSPFLFLMLSEFHQSKTQGSMIGDGGVAVGMNADISPFQKQDFSGAASDHMHRAGAGFHPDSDDEGAHLGQYVEDEKVNLSDDMGHPEGHISQIQELSDERSESEVLGRIRERIFSHLEEIRIPPIVKFMLDSQEGLDEVLSPADVDSLKDEIVSIFANTVEELIEAVINQDNDKWYQTLGIQEPHSQQEAYLANLVDNLKELSRLREEILTVELIDEWSQLLLQTPELKHELGKLVLTKSLEAQNQ